MAPIGLVLRIALARNISQIKVEGERMLQCARIVTAFFLIVAAVSHNVDGELLLIGWSATQHHAHPMMVAQFAGGLV